MNGDETTVYRDGCLHTHSKVVDSRPSGYPHIVQSRRRECLSCGKRYSTVELYLDDYQEIGRYNRELKIERMIKKGLKDARAYGAHFTATP